MDEVGEEEKLTSSSRSMVLLPWNRDRGDARVEVSKAALKFSTL